MQYMCLCFIFFIPFFSFSLDSLSHYRSLPFIRFHILAFERSRRFEPRGVFFRTFSSSCGGPTTLTVKGARKRVRKYKKIYIFTEKVISLTLSATLDTRTRTRRRHVPLPPRRPTTPPAPGLPSSAICLTSAFPRLSKEQSVYAHAPEPPESRPALPPRPPAGDRPAHGVDQVLGASSCAAWA